MKTASFEIITYLLPFLYMAAMLPYQSSSAPTSPPAVSDPDWSLCTVNPQLSLDSLKTFSCMLEKDIFESLKNPSIPSMNKYSFAEQEQCNCQGVSNQFKYNPNPPHGVTPHVRITTYYKSYQKPSRYPENTVDLNGATVPLTTEWILKDYLRSIKGFVEYFSQSSLTGPELMNIIIELNTTILAGTNSFNFTFDCTSSYKPANFSSTVDDNCELKCATMHFNETLSNFDYVLMNQHIYESKNVIDPTRLADWQTADCCPLLKEAHTLPPSEYRYLTCSTQKLNYDSYVLFQQLGQSATTECEGVSTVSGIKNWTSYYNQSFPPTLSSCSGSYDDMLYVYANHFDALDKHASDLASLISDTSFDCFSPLAKDTMIAIRNKLDSTLPLTKQWMKGHGCPYCSGLTCTPPEDEKPAFNSIELHEACPNAHKEISCLAIDVQTVATSLYMFLELRPEAKDTWSISCDSFQ